MRRDWRALAAAALLVMAVDPAASISIQQSRYQEPVQIPSVAEVKAILAAADQLANHKNYWIAQA